MKIVSKFEDYYDGCTYMCGENVFYKRTLNLMTLTDNKELYSNKYYVTPPIAHDIGCLFVKYIGRNHFSTSGNVHKSICIIGELVIPFITIKTKGELRPKTWQHGSDYYDYSFEFIFDESKVSDKFLKEHLTKSHVDLYNAIRQICAEPIISYSSYEDMYSELPDNLKMSSGCTINPVLKRLGFSKVIPNHTVIQELELYLNKLANPESAVQMPDNIKIQSKGFDKKSFRRQKKR